MICTHVKKSSYSSKNLKNLIIVLRSQFPYQLYSKSTKFVINALILSVLISFTSHKIKIYKTVLKSLRHARSTHGFIHFIRFVQLLLCISDELKNIKLLASFLRNNKTLWACFSYFNFHVASNLKLSYFINILIKSYPFWKVY